MTTLQAQTILVTGATDGLGLGVATELARAGAHVLVHGRDDRRGEAAIANIKRATGSDRLAWYRADFSSLEEVRELAKRVLHDQPRLDVLVNNAGLGVERRRHTSRDGHELTFQVDYLAPYLLTRRLLPLLLRSAPARIVNVTSAGQSPIDFTDPMLERSYDGAQAYCQAKLAEIMMTIDLAEELEGRGVTVNSLHPASYMPTKIVVGLFTPQSSVDEGVKNTLRLVTSPEVRDMSGRILI